MTDRRISLDEQRQQGIVRKQYPENYVPAAVGPIKLEILPPFEASLNVDHPAKMQTIVTTSAVDRGKAFQMMILPIAVVVAILAVIVSLAFESDLFSFATILIFWITFVVVYVAGMGLTALATPEAVSLYSAKRQWDVIDREQRERWAHYKRLTGATEDEGRTIDPQHHQANTNGLWAFLERYAPWLIMVGLAYGTLAVFILMNLGGE